MRVTQDMLISLLGWWLAKRESDPDSSGWAPAAYLEEYVARPAPPPAPPAAARAVPTPPNGAANGSVAGGKPKPPAPPAKRPASKKPAPPAAPRDSGYSGSTGDNTPRDSGGSIAGGLAEALKARQAAMNSKRDTADDW